MTTLFSRFFEAIFVRRTRRTVDVSVVIPCHNYAEYLPRAIESVLRQTVRPHQILVIDDSSSDATKDVTLSYATKGVTYLRVEHRNLSKTRNTGTEHTHGSFVLFLDADDYLADDYVERCYEVCKDYRIGFAYGDVQKFGIDATFRRSPDFDQTLFLRSNYICSHALIRREALLLCGGYRSIPHAMEDWDFYRRAVSLGFSGVRADTKSYYFIHSDSMLQRHKAGPHFTYCNDAALFFQPMTIGLLLGGDRTMLEACVDDLRRLDFDVSLLHLHVCVLSDDPAFLPLVRSSMMSLPFGSIHVSDFRLQEQSMRDLQATMQIVCGCDTAYLWMLRDHVSFSPDILRQLLRRMHSQVIAVLVPLEPHHVWSLQDESIVRCTESGKNIERMVGGGFDCTLFRTQELRSVLPLSSSVFCKKRVTFEEAAFLRLRAYGHVLCDWTAPVHRRIGSPCS